MKLLGPGGIGCGIESLFKTRKLPVLREELIPLSSRAKSYFSNLHDMLLCPDHSDVFSCVSSVLKNLYPYGQEI